MGGQEVEAMSRDTSFEKCFCKRNQRNGAVAGQGCGVRKMYENKQNLIEKSPLAAFQLNVKTISTKKNLGDLNQDPYFLHEESEIQRGQMASCPKHRVDKEQGEFRSLANITEPHQPVTRPGHAPGTPVSDS